VKTKNFLSLTDEQAVVDAIREAELRTSGEIRVCVSNRRTFNAVQAAEREFERLGLTKTRRRNGVLIFVAPRSRNFAVVGDEGVHAKGGMNFWEETSAAMEGHFRQGDFTRGLQEGVRRAADLLARHFPPEGEPENELPDDITH
jgi:uncharacterized membrane protein